MRNSGVKRERGTIQKKILPHINMLQQWFSMLSTSKELVKGNKRKRLLIPRPQILSMKILKASVCTLWNLRSPCTGKMLKISILKMKEKVT